VGCEIARAEPRPACGLRHACAGRVLEPANARRQPRGAGESCLSPGRAMPQPPWRGSVRVCAAAMPQPFGVGMCSAVQSSRLRRAVVAPPARSRRAFGAIGSRAHSACTLLGLRQLSPAPRTCGPRSQARELAQQGMPRARAGGGIMAGKRGVSVDIADMKEVWHESARVCRMLA